MREIFADTSGWASFFVSGERYHAQAREKMRQWRSNNDQLITTNYVLLELVALMTSPLRVPRIQQIMIIETIQAAAWVEVVHVDSTLDVQTLTLFKQRRDKMWSLVDCSSFVVMHHRGITEAFTTDHHFEQSGFIRTLS
jgi:uncharacterized protein